MILLCSIILLSCMDIASCLIYFLYLLNSHWAWVTKVAFCFVGCMVYACHSRKSCVHWIIVILVTGRVLVLAWLNFDMIQGAWNRDLCEMLIAPNKNFETFPWKISCMVLCKWNSWSISLLVKVLICPLLLCINEEKTVVILPFEPARYMQMSKIGSPKIRHVILEHLASSFLSYFSLMLHGKDIVSCSFIIWYLPDICILFVVLFIWSYLILQG